MAGKGDKMNLKFQYPSVETLRRLFFAAGEYRVLAPWQWMGGREVVAVHDPLSERVAYCVVMGGEGVYFGLEAMLGDRGLSAYRKTISGEVVNMGIGLVHFKDSLALFFEDKSTLLPEDRALCQVVGMSSAAALAWPQFRRFEPGFFPWLPEERDAVFLAVCLEQVVEVARRAKDTPAILGPRDHQTFLARIPDHVNGKIVWREELVSPEPLARIIRIIPKVDQVKLGQVFGAAKKTGMTWEADCFYGHNPVGGPDERARYPFLYMMVDNKSGYILHINAVDENDHGSGFLDHLCAAVKTNRIFPGMIHIRQPHLTPLFAPLAAFGISTRIVKALPMIDDAREEMFKAFKKKAGGRSGKKQTTRAGKNVVYQFKVTLDNVRPAIWRRVQVKGDSSLKRLAATILIVMGWTNSHLHQFHIGGRRIGLAHDDCDELDDFEDEDNFRLCDLSPDEIKRFVFEYDFGDGWKHSILLEKTLELQKGIKYPTCLAGKNSCPPEDCGGPGGYVNFLEVISDLEHPEHESMVEWSGGGFNPEAFNVDVANHQLKYFIRKTEKNFDE